ncbi:MAG: GNAT family N-acetyltransferase [Saprospiraceae bacterium]|nr:GNAT family N-acetyltransferase [Saprospiraceae bacterium]
MQSEEIFFSNEWLETFAPQRKEINIQFDCSHLQCVFVEKRKFGIKYYKSLPYTPFNAVIEHHNSDMKEYTKFSSELQLYHALMKALKGVSAAHLKFNIPNLSLPRISDKRIVSNLAYTEIVRNPIDMSLLWEKMTTDNKKKILNVNGIETITDVTKVHEIVDFLLNNKYYVSAIENKERLVALIRKALAANHVRIVGVNRNDSWSAVSLFVRSKNTVYYWMNYVDKSEKPKGGQRALVWKGIEWANESGCDFNFDGSTIEDIARVNKIFGTETIIFPSIYYIDNPLLRMIKKIM